MFVLIEPCYEKTCLAGLRPGKTDQDSNRPVQLQRLARVLFFILASIRPVLYYPGSEHIGADQTARMHRLICAFVVRIWHKQIFS